MPTSDENIVYTALLIHDGERILDEQYSSPERRLHYVTAALKSHCSDVDEEQIADEFETDQSVNETLEAIAGLYSDYGVDAYFDTMPDMRAPKTLYSVYTEYRADRLNTIVHYPSREARREALRTWAAGLAAGEVSEDSSTSKCLKIINKYMTAAEGRVVLYEAAIDDHGVYRADVVI